MPTLKVTDIPPLRPSGNIHDYASVSRYRWANPDTPDGLPWVRRDGELNPDTKNPHLPADEKGNTSALARCLLAVEKRYPGEGYGICAKKTPQFRIFARVCREYQG